MISIIIPAYQAEHTIAETLASVLAQNTDMQIIVVDDGSTDRTAAIVQDFSRRYPYVEYHHQFNSGVAAARNLGLTKAKGEWVFFLDADDCLLEHTFACMMKEIREEVDLIAVGFVRSDHRKCAVRRKQVLNQKEYLRELCKDRVIRNYAWGKLIRRSRLDGFSFENWRAFEDVASHVAMIERCRTIVVLPVAKVYYRTGQKSSLTSGMDEACLELWMDACRKQGQDMITRYPSLRRSVRQMLIEHVLVCGVLRMRLACFREFRHVKGWLHQLLIEGI